MVNAGADHVLGASCKATRLLRINFLILTPFVIFDRYFDANKVFLFLKIDEHHLRIFT